MSIINILIKLIDLYENYKTQDKNSTSITVCLCNKQHAILIKNTTERHYSPDIKCTYCVI